MEKLTASDIIDAEKLELLKAYLSQGKRIADLTETPQETLESLYYHARANFSLGKYNNAIMLCSHLTIQDHLNDKYWELLGLCAIRTKRYSYARLAFTRALFLDMSNPAYSFYIAQLNELEYGLKESLFAYRKALEHCDHVKNENVASIRRLILEKLKGAI